MSALYWSVPLLVVTIAGLLGLSTLTRGVRVAFDVVCLIALSAALYRHGITPLSPSFDALSATSVIWLRLITIAWWLLVGRLIVGLVYFTSRHDRKSRQARLFIDLTAAAIYLGIVLIVLKSVLDLPIGGLVTTSGIVAIVLGLALQSTLSDVFSGIAVGVEEPFRVGDRVSLGTNIEGQVIEMNWRSVRVQTDGADIAIIPNSVVAKLEIVNRSVPSRIRAVSVQLWCASGADPERVIEVLRQTTMLCPSLLETPAPSVALTRVGPRWANYTISFSVQDTPLVSTTKSLLLSHALKQLYFAGLLGRCKSRDVRPPLGERRYARILLPLDILREITLFECLQPAQLEGLASHVVTRPLEPRELLFSQGATDATLYIIAAGVLEISQQPTTGAAVTLGCLGAGEYLGEIGLLTGAPHAATARARTRCDIYQLSRDALQPLLAASPDLAAAFDRSARRGLDVLHRSVAVQATEDIGEGKQLLNRILAFFRPRPAVE